MNTGYQYRYLTPNFSFERSGDFFGILLGDGLWVLGDRKKKMYKKIESYEDLDVYQKLLSLHLQVNEITLSFPKFELYELGSQVRRSSNSAPANLAEGWNNKHINIYLEGINRALGEINETRHHLLVASKKKYIDDERYQYLVGEYHVCGRMLTNLKRSLINFRQNPNIHNPTPMTQHP